MRACFVISLLTCACAFTLGCILSVSRRRSVRRKGKRENCDSREGSSSHLIHIAIFFMYKKKKRKKIDEEIISIKGLLSSHAYDKVPKLFDSAKCGEKVKTIDNRVVALSAQKMCKVSCAYVCACLSLVCIRAGTYSIEGREQSLFGDEKCRVNSENNSS